MDERQVFVCKLIGKKKLFYKGDMMKITYINHSGFLIETKDCYYIFDYYKGELPLLDKKKEVIVFCSHFHKDHFNIIYNKNSPTSAGSEMNCRSEHKCSKEFYK